MSEFPSLAEVLAAHWLVDYAHDAAPAYDCECGAEFDGLDQYLVHQADAWREACTIRTVKQLDALPVNALGCEGVVVKDATGAICERDDDGTWTRDGDTLTPSSRLSLPSLLIWHPDWERP